MAATASNGCNEKAHFTFIWVVENSSALAVSVVKSPEFIVKSKENTQWKLKLASFIKERTMFIGITTSENAKLDNEIEAEFSFGNKYEKVLKLKMDYDASLFDIRAILNINDILYRRKSDFVISDPFSVCCRIWTKNTEISNPGACFARSRACVYQNSFIWTINEFSSLKPGYYKTHFVNATPNRSPQLILKLCLVEKKNKNYITIQSERNCEHSLECIFCKFSVLNKNGSEIHSVVRCVFISELFQETISVEFIEKNKLVNGRSLLMPNDVLCLRCEFLLGADPTLIKMEYYNCYNLKDTKKIKCPKIYSNDSRIVDSMFKKAFKLLYMENSLTDTIIKANTKTFPVHKNILCARSPVFQAMFRHDMREKTINMVNITDLNSDTVYRMLLYIYMGAIRELKWESALNLYIAADKYQVLNLRDECSLFLRSNISLGNVCYVLLLVDMIGDDGLKKSVEGFLSENYNVFFKSAKWKSFREKNRLLALQITERVIHLKEYQAKEKDKLSSKQRYGRSNTRTYLQIDRFRPGSCSSTI